jgi:LysM repeat protein
MKATLLLLASVSLLASCTQNQGQVGDPVAPPVSSGNQYGVPQAQAPYQPIDPINPPAAPVQSGIPTPVGVPSPGLATPSPAPSPELNGNVYTIKKGDSLWGIARKFNTTVEALKEVNGLTGNTIIDGKTLVIPGR